MTPGGQSDDPGRGTSGVPSRSYAATAGLIAGAMTGGVGLLAARLVEWVTGVAGAWPFELLFAASTTGAPARPVLASVGAFLAVGLAAGLVGRHRPKGGIGILVVVGLAWAVALRSFDLVAQTYLVPVLATLAGAGTLLLLSRIGRRTAGTDRPGSGDGDRRPTGGAGVPSLSRRRALLAGMVVAVVAGIAGTVGAAAAPPRPPVRRVGPQAAGGGPLLEGTVFDVREFGAAGDGLADDSDPIQAAVGAASRERGTVHFPAGVYRYASSLPLSPGSGVTMSGEVGASTIDFAPSGAAGFMSCIQVDADDVTIDGLVLRRAADLDMVVLATGAFNRLTLSRTSLAGNADAFPATFCHGIKLSDESRSSGLRLVDSSMTAVDYGLLQTNESTAVTAGILVERCAFAGNRSTDLEFNSPQGAIRDVTVVDSTFSDNYSTGFGVGLAKVEDVVIRGNTFDNYAMEAVHVEDYSVNVRIESNRFTSCGLRMHANVQLIGGSSELSVLANTFEASLNTIEIFAVTAQPGGVGPTGSGRETVPPYDVAVHGNVFACSPFVTPVYFQGTTRGSIVANTVTGSAIAGPADAFELLDVDGVVVRDNVVNGARS